LIYRKGMKAWLGQLFKESHYEWIQPNLLCKLHTG